MKVKTSLGLSSGGGLSYYHNKFKVYENKKYKIWKYRQIHLLLQKRFRFLSLKISLLLLFLLV